LRPWGGSFRRFGGVANIIAISSKGSEMALNRIRTAFVLTPILLASVCAGSATASPVAHQGTDDPIVARIDDTQIRRSDLIIALQLLPAQYRKMPLDAIYPFVLRQVINNTLIVRAARAEGFEKSETIRQRLKAIERRLVEGAYLQQAAKGKVTETAMRERYRNVSESLRGKEELRVRHILVKDKREAESIIKQLSKGSDFAKLARENSMGPSKTVGGDLGFMSHNNMVERFADAAFGLKTGQVTPMPVETRFGWHVIKLEERRAMKIPSFEDMRAQLARQIRAKIAVELVKNLRRNATIEQFDIHGKSMPSSASRSMPDDKR
jgi:peptidyl-prolyl cis-trans isomerase C